MQSIYDLLTNQPHSYTNILIWAACSLAFFGFLRVSEFMIPGDANYDDECHLSLADVSFDNCNNPQLLRVKLKQSKIYPFRRGVDIYLGATGRTLCPIKAILPYLASRPKHHNSPLFIFEDGCSLTRQHFSSLLQNLLSRLGFDSTQYNTHNFRIGAATTAVQVNIPHTSIQMLRRWKSNAYQLYIETRAGSFFKIHDIKLTAAHYLPMASREKNCVCGAPLTPNFPFSPKLCNMLVL